MADVIDFYKAKEDIYQRQMVEEFRANINVDFVKGQIFMLDQLIKSFELNKPINRFLSYDALIKSLLEYKEQLQQGLNMID